MARQFIYVCTRCGNKPHPNDNEARELLTAKVVQFKEVGYRGKVIRSRVTAWLCPDCLKIDDTYNSPDRAFISKVASDVQFN